MNPGIAHFLIIEKGEPHKMVDRIQLKSESILIGRSSANDKPDIVFDSPYVSRKHANLTLKADSLLIEDLNSKHGTAVNGIGVGPNQPYSVNDGDQIVIARGIVVMTYKVTREFEDRTITMTNIFPKSIGPLVIDLDKREVSVEGQPLNFSGKEKDLLLMLYCNRNRAVSYDEIKDVLWPERKIDGQSVPDVGNDEINALVYRLRKRLGRGADHIVTVPRYGIILKTDQA